MWETKRNYKMNTNTLFAQYFTENPMWQSINFDVFHCGFMVWVGPDDIALMKTKLKEYIDDNVANGAKYVKDPCKDLDEALTDCQRVGARGMTIWEGKHYKNRTHFMFIITNHPNGRMPHDDELLGIISHESDHMADYVVAMCRLNPTRVVPCEVHAYIVAHAVRKIMSFFNWKMILKFFKDKFESEKEKDFQEGLKNDNS